jgi:hypothetical protein
LVVIGENLAKRLAAKWKATGFPGIWDSSTGDGVKYTVTLNSGGSGSIGAVNAAQDGTITGTLSGDGKSLAFVMTQPQVGVTSRGQLSLSEDGQTFAGTITKDTDGQSLNWTGKRRN